MSLCMRKPTIWVSDQVDTNQPVQSQKIARSLKFRMKEEEGLCYPCSKNKGADQLRGYREAGLHLCLLKYIGGSLSNWYAIRFVLSTIFVLLSTQCALLFKIK